MGFLSPALNLLESVSFWRRNMSLISYDLVSFFIFGKCGNLKTIIQIHATYSITFMTKHLLKIFSTCYVMIEKKMCITWKSVDFIFFSYWKILAGKNFAIFSLAKVSLAKFSSFPKVYQKNVASFLLAKVSPNKVITLF